MEMDAAVLFANILNYYNLLLFYNKFNEYILFSSLIKKIENESIN